MENYIGHKLGGRYEVREVIGTGGMAVVYKAYCTVLNRYVAIKILKDEFASDEEFRRRFYNEAQAVAKLSHNSIVSIYDVCHDEDGSNYIVMELCEGVTLKDYLRKKHHLTWQETLYFAEQVARALDHAHSRGIIHQDIKPQNIMLLRDGTAKVMDFGIASFANSQETRKVTSEAIGSVHYISPEQAKGITADFRTDLYSLGIVMYEMLTGTLPFRGETAVAVVMQHLNTVPPLPSSIVPEIPKAMDEIVMHAMCANASQRYSSALDMYRDMERLRANPNLVLNYSGHNSDLDATRTIKYDEEATQLLHTADEGQQTQYMPPVQGSSPQRKQVYQPSNEQDDEEEQEKPVYPAASALSDNENKSSSKAVIIGVVIVILLAACAYLASANGLFGGGSENTVGSGNGTGEQQQLVHVPNFISLNYEKDIRDNAEYQDFTFDIERFEDSSGEYEDGEIIDQSPRANTQVRPGTAVTLTVAAVVEPEEKDDDTENTQNQLISVPSVVGETYEGAQSILRARGLTAKRSDRSSETAEAGTVIGTDPEEGKRVKAGSSVTVIVSSGPENTDQEVPPLAGMTRSAAKALLESYGLQLGSVSEEESDLPAGTVIRQTINAGESVPKGTSVGIVIAKAPEDTPTDNEPDLNPEENPNDTPTSDKPEEPTGSSASSVSFGDSYISVSLPTDRDKATVTVSVNGSQIYNYSVSTSRGAARCRVAYSGVKPVVVTVDGQTIFNGDHDFG